MKKLSHYISFVLILINSFAFAGEQPQTDKAKGIIISGKITDVKSNELLAGVKISCPNCQKTVYSDLEGNFFIYLDADTSENLKLEFSQVGYSSKTIDVKEIQSDTNDLYIDLRSE